MGLLLILVSGLAWTIVYVEASRVGFRDRTYAMPAVAMGLNFAWEWTYAVRSLSGGSAIQGVIDLVWGMGDVLIAYTFFRYGRAELPSFVTRGMFAGWGVLVFGISFATQWLFIVQFGGWDAAVYSSFLQNLLMSGLFIAMFVGRRGLRGQSLTIAVAKWLGTLAPTILFGGIGHRTFVLGIGLMCSVLDLVYIGLCVWAKRNSAALAQAPLQRAGLSESAVLGK